MVKFKIRRNKGRSWRDPVIVIAHRGASVYNPVDAISAMERAFEIGVDGVEIDLRMTRDGHIVVLHDERVKRGLKPVREMTLQEIRKFLGYKAVLTLEEVCEIFSNNAILMLDIKERGFEERLVEIIEDFKMDKRVIACGTIHGALLKIKKLNGSIRIASSYSTASLETVEDAYLLGFDIYNPCYLNLKREIVNQAHRLGMKVTTWIVDNPSDIKKVLNMRVDGLITDYPHIARSILASQRRRV